jgi:carbon-monoxide dehydrogenase large subunit
MRKPPRPALPTDKVRFVGDPIAFVVAETPLQAKDAAEAVEVDIDPLPAVVRVEDAVREGAPQIHAEAPGNVSLDYHYGDSKQVAEAFAKAAHVTKLKLINTRLVVNPLEPRAAIGSYDPAAGRFTLHIPSQGVFGMKGNMAEILKVEPKQMRVLTGNVGGSFGMKSAPFPEYVCVLHAARELGRPVKWTDERSGSFVSDSHGRDHEMTGELALDADGTFLAVRLTGLGNCGAFLAQVAPMPSTLNAVKNVQSVYRTPLIEVSTKCVFTNTTHVSAYRGAGRPEGNYYMERLIDAAAAEMDIDRLELRRRNHIRPREIPRKTASGMEYDSGDFPGLLKHALEFADVKGFGKRKRESARHNKLRGIGYSTYIEACGIAPSQAVGSLGAGVGLWESAEVRVNPTGSVEVLTGSHAHGQGHETTFAQLVSERLGIPFENVSIVHGDTDKVQFGMGTYGSRSGAVGMSAVVKAMDKVIAKAKKVAAFMMEASEGDIEFKDGKFTVAGTDKSAAWGDVALNAYIAHKFTGAELEPGLKETSFYDPTNFTFPAGCHICEVEVDSDTGRTQIVNWTAVDDFGTVINPMIVEGQVHGGIAQGVGQALLEGAVYDKDGQLVSGSLMDYSMPRAHDLPSFRLGLTETKSPSNPLGIKGCGEAGAIAAPAAVINAITDAIGTEQITMPATAQTVWSALQRANAARQAAE